MAFTLNDILNDGRLERLFSKDGRDCALQLWILQIRSALGIENRLLYGRLLPYSHSSNTWYATDDDHFEPVGEPQAQVIRVTLYIKSSDTTALLKHLSDGHDLTLISDELKLNMQQKIAGRVGTTRIGFPIVYRPVAYLLNRDAPGREAPRSPHGAAGAFSASMSQSDKLALFRIGADFDDALIKFIIEQLSADTGLDFGHNDITRLGDLELLVFPTLDDSERELLSAGWKGEPGVFTVKLNPMQLPHYNRFHVRLCVTNDNQLIHACMATVECFEGDVISCEFSVPVELHPIADSTEVEIYGSRTDDVRAGTLCCRWGIGYIREININGNLVGNGGGSVQLDWLVRVTKSPTSSERLKAAQLINQGRMGFETSVGGRKADPWVPVNHEVRSLFAKLHPSHSEGRFFDRLSDSGGLSRLDFVEWIKDLLIKNQNHQILIFDPYFEDAGIGLIVPNAGNQGDYVVFTTLPKPPKQKSRFSLLLGHLKKWWTLENLSTAKDRINNLLSSCEQLKPLLKSVRLRVYGLKDGALHDRYILIAGKDGSPITGFNLSNSIQKANENYPLLITPIPADVLLRVLKYASELLGLAVEESAADGGSASRIKLIFDSNSTRQVPRKRFERLRFLKNSVAGDVLSGWTGEQSLRGLKNDALRQRMRELGLLQEESLVLKDRHGLITYLDQQTGDFSNFTAHWDVLGEVLAHSPAGDLLGTADLSAKTAFLNFLAQFLRDSFDRIHSEEVDAPIAVVASSYFQESIEGLLTKPYKPHHFVYPVKYAALTWSEYFAINIMWSHDPDALLSITEAQVATVLLEERQREAVKLSLLSQIVSEIAVGAEFGLNDVQRDRLVRSTNGLLKWLGLNALESQLKNAEGVRDLVRYTSSFSNRERIQTIGWMTNHFAGKPDEAMTFQSLVDSLHAIMPKKISAEIANLLVDSLRGHMRRLGWCEPWLFEDVIRPLMVNARVEVDDLCSIWITELITYFEETLNDQVCIFKRNAEGRVTEVAASLFSRSGLQQQRTVMESLQRILARVRRDIQQPLASTLNWTKWDTSLVIIMWILAFTKWASHFITTPSGIEPELEQLSNEAGCLALIRPINEWRSQGVEPGGLVKFIEEVGEI
ncbi:MAG: VPA1262 family protein [Smithellaceae bacterium]